MEATLFHRDSKKAKPTHSKPLKALSGIEAPAALLMAEKRQTLLAHMKQTAHLEPSRFESLCMTLIQNIVHYYQSLPETSNSYYAQPGGLLDHALNRTEIALQLFQNHLLREESVLSESQKQWMYALFSAGLLQGCGKLYTNYLVDLFDSNGQYLKHWNPLLETMTGAGHYYHFEFQKEPEEIFQQRLNVLLGHTMMPAQGYAWIASNANVLATWLALLNEDWYSAGTLGAILIHADAIAIQRYFNDFLIQHAATGTGRTNRISTFIDTKPDTSIKEQLIGIEFIQWLTHAMETGALMINQSPLFMVPGGMLMHTDIFKYFIREHPEFKTWQAVQNGFLSLGLHRTNAEGQIISRFEQSKNQSILSGIVFSNYAVALPNHVQMRHVNTGKVSTASSIELIHKTQTGTEQSSLKHLSSKGEWQSPEAPNRTITPGTHYHD